MSVVVGVFTSVLMVEVLVLGVKGVVLVEVRSVGGVDVEVLDVELVLGVSVTGLVLDAGTNDEDWDGVLVLGVTIVVLVEVKSARAVEVGVCDVAVGFGVSAAGLMLDDGTDHEETDGTDEDLDTVAGFVMLLEGLLVVGEDGAEERVVGAEGEVEACALVTEVLN